MDNIEDYCLEYSSKESNLLLELKNYTFKNEEAPQMISGPLVGNLLNILIKISNAKKILEIGMFTGYSALKMAEALPEDGQVHTCELMDRHIQTASSFFNKSPHKNKIQIEILNVLIMNFQITIFIHSFYFYYLNYSLS